MRMFCPFFLSPKRHVPLCLSSGNVRPFLSCWRSSAQMLRPWVSQPDDVGAELPMFELYLSTPKPAWAQSSGWSYCSPSVLGTTPPRHMERGRDAIKLSTSWGVCAWAVARSLNVVLTHLCACVRIRFPALLMEGTPRFWWLKASWRCKCRVHSGKHSGGFSSRPIVAPHLGISSLIFFGLAGGGI